MSTVTPELAEQIAEAIAAMPVSHRETPLHDEIVESVADGLLRIQNWAFTQGYAVAIESGSENSKTNRVQIGCIRHFDKTRNTRKTKEEDRERAETNVRAMGCPFKMYMSKKKKNGYQWAIGWTHKEHTCNPLPDPFVVKEHRDKRPGHARAVQIAATHRGVIGYKDSDEILEREGLKLGRKEYYNLDLDRKARTTKLTPQEELQVLMDNLESHGYHARVREDYETKELQRQRIVRDIFFISNEQIRQARRFVSGFMYETDATFNTNSLRMPLSVMVGINNIGKTFPMAFCYITSESAISFKWVSEQLTDLIFYDCLWPMVVCGDFSKGLGKCVADKADEDVRKDREAVEKARQAKALLFANDSISSIDEIEDKDTIVVDVVVNSEGERMILQLCEWHAIEAIKKRLIHSGRYCKERREELVSLVNNWVKSASEDLDENRDKLEKELHEEERQYLRSFYRPKEPQFTRVYTRYYKNLGVYSTQRNESYHVVVKQKLNKHLPIHKAVDTIVQKTNKLATEYNKAINEQRKALPRLLDNSAFGECGKLLTHYCLDFVSHEWRVMKNMADEIEEGKINEFVLDEEEGCQFQCELPIRYGIPCKHWLYQSFIEKTQVPVSLFHPRWLLDGPLVVRRGDWKMGRGNQGNQPPLIEDIVDRYKDHGEQMIKDEADEAIRRLRRLPAGQKEGYASTTAMAIAAVADRQDFITLSRTILPARLPDPLVEPPLKFKGSRKRALTGREAAEDEERDKARTVRRNAREAELRKKEEEIDKRDTKAQEQVEEEIEEVDITQSTSEEDNEEKEEEDDDEDGEDDEDDEDEDGQIVVPSSRPSRTLYPSWKVARNESQLAKKNSKKESRKATTSKKRGKKAEAAAKVSQLDDVLVALPFRSSQ